MGKNIQKKIPDVTGVELTPGKPAICLGNGDQGFACCCDECDYYLVTSKNSLDGESVVTFPSYFTYFSSRSSTTRAKNCII